MGVTSGRANGLGAGCFAGVAVALAYVLWSEKERLRLQALLDAHQSREYAALEEKSGDTPGDASLDWFGKVWLGKVVSISVQMVREVPLAVYLHVGVFLSVVGWLLWMLRRELNLIRSNRMLQQRAQEWIGVGEELVGELNPGLARSVSLEQLRIREQIDKTLHFGIKDYVLYRMDYVLSTWASAKPTALLLATYLLIISGAVMYYFVADGDHITFSEAIWIVWTFVADPGTHAEEKISAQRVVALMVTIGGMLIFALMIGIIADGVSDLLDSLKKGKSRVIESGHTLILGWSDKVIPTIRELAIANESEGGGVVVLLSERPKEEMEKDLQDALSPDNLMGTTVICRSGSPLIMTDLLKVSAQTAKSVVVVSDPEIDPDESDARAVRIVMSLTGIDVQSHIVVEMCDVDNRELVLLVGKGKVETVVAHDIIGRLMIQCARQPGLAQILEQLLGFAGDEFYFEEWPSLVGKTFLEASFAFDQAVPIGVKPANSEDAARQMQELITARPSSPGMRSFRSATGLKENETPALARGSIRKKKKQQRLFSASSASLTSTTSASASSSASMDDLPAPLPIAVQEHQTPQPNPQMEGQNKGLGRSRTTSLTSTGVGKEMEVILNPPDGYVIKEGDKVLVIAEDDDSYEARHDGNPVCEAARRAYFSVNSQTPMLFEHLPERLLFCGWRRDMDDMISELDKLVQPNSQLVLMCTLPEEERLQRFRDAHKMDIANLMNLQIVHEVGNPVLRRHLERMPLETFSSILILADEAFETNMQTADSRSLASLLLIRDIIEKREAAQRGVEMNSSFGMRSMERRSISPTPRKPVGSRNQYFEEEEQEPAPTPQEIPEESVFEASPEDGGTADLSSDDEEISKLLSGVEGARLRLQRQTTAEVRQGIKRSWCPTNHESEQEEQPTIIISEILDSRTKSLISVAEVSDYVMSNEIVACAMSMVAEDRMINAVLTELLSATGCEIQVRSCLEYCEVEEVLDWWTMMARARKRYEVAIGYKCIETGKAYINPRQKSKLRVWSRGDAIVVLTHNG